MTMSSSRDDEWLSAYLDGELDETETAELEARLARDPALAAQLDAVLDVIVALRGLDQVSPPEGLEARVFERLSEERPETPVIPLRRRWSLRAISSVAAAVALVGLGSVALIQQSQRLADRSVVERAVAARESQPTTLPETAAPEDPAVTGSGTVIPDENTARIYFTTQLERLQSDARHGAVDASGPCHDVVAPPGGTATVADVEPIVYEGKPALAYIVLHDEDDAARAVLTDPQTCRIEVVIVL